jgi:formylglycine-generating enzyme
LKRKRSTETGNQHLRVIPQSVRLALLLAALSSGCGRSVKTVTPASPPVLTGMVQIPAGTYSLGAGRLYDEELPVRSVKSSGFLIDRTEVTNAEFKRFVDATGYVTFAEKSPSGNSTEAPAGSACCRAARDTKEVNDRWEFVVGANWKHPGGKGTDLTGRLNYPVVHLTFKDAEAYARWAGKDLPTQDEWEIAARGGLVNQTYEWGSELNPKGKWRANTYQGEFPKKDSGVDGFSGLAPAGSFPPNGFGLYDMTGNVWELTADEAPRDGFNQPCYWAKGGSFLCAPNYCARYRPAARIGVNAFTSTEHIGFRCVKRENQGIPGK